MVRIARRTFCLWAMLLCSLHSEYCDLCLADISQCVSVVKSSLPTHDIYAVTFESPEITIRELLRRLSNRMGKPVTIDGSTNEFLLRKFTDRFPAG